MNCMTISLKKVISKMVRILILGLLTYFFSPKTLGLPAVLIGFHLLWQFETMILYYIVPFCLANHNVTCLKLDKDWVNNLKQRKNISFSLVAEFCSTYIYILRNILVFKMNQSSKYTYFNTWPGRIWSCSILSRPSAKAATDEDALCTKLVCVCDLDGSIHTTWSAIFSCWLTVACPHIPQQSRDTSST